jgi:electron transfer flavoprotein-quinone oxidoreductase
VIPRQESEIRIPLDYISKDGNNFLTWVEAHSTTTECKHDAAVFVFSNGLTINGMNYGIRSGIIAADALAQAKLKNNYSSKGLAIYQKNIKKSYFFKTMKKFRKVDKYLTNPRVFNKYAEVLTGGLKDMLTENQQDKPKAISAMFKNLKKKKVWKVRAILDALSLRHL